MGPPTPLNENSGLHVIIPSSVKLSRVNFHWRKLSGLLLHFPENFLLSIATTTYYSSPMVLDIIHRHKIKYLFNPFFFFNMRSRFAYQAAYLTSWHGCLIFSVSKTNGPGITCLDSSSFSHLYILMQQFNAGLFQKSSPNLSSHFTLCSSIHFFNFRFYIQVCDLFWVNFGIWIEIHCFYMWMFNCPCTICRKVYFLFT